MALFSGVRVTVTERTISNDIEHAGRAFSSTANSSLGRALLEIREETLFLRPSRTSHAYSRRHDDERENREFFDVLSRSSIAIA